jgi:copper oxidase (laccase) domain-containing protein
MNYNCAIAAIGCIIKSCDWEVQDKIIKEIVKLSPEYLSEWERKHKLPSQAELMRRAYAKIEKAGARIQRLKDLKNQSTDNQESNFDKK